MYGRTFGDVLDACAANHPRAIALVHGARRSSYADAIGELRACGRALRAAGLRPGDSVGILMQDSPELITAMYGALWAGITIVPLNTRLGLEDHAYIVEDSDVRALLFDEAMTERARALLRDADVALVASTHRDPPFAGCRSLPAMIDEHSRAAGSPRDVDPESPVWIQYTGGTTGAPKGAVHSHRTMLTALLSCALEFDIRSDERCAFVAPLTHSGAGMFLPVWLRGGTNILLDGFDPERLLEAIERERVTSTLLVPTMLSLLLAHPSLAQRDLSSLRTVVYGAAPIGRKLLETALERLGPVLLQAYGQTEAFCQITVLTKDDHVTAQRRPALLASCGRPVALCELRVVDESSRPSRPARRARSWCAARTRSSPIATSPRRQRRRSSTAGCERGDIGRRDEDGYVYLVDRMKDMIITGGFNVYPKEVEQVLDRHAAVDAVCVIGVPDDKWGEAVTAVVVASEQVEAEELISFVKARKGSVAAPKSVEFLDALPVTSLGKVDKKALRARYRSQLQERTT